MRAAEGNSASPPPVRADLQWRLEHLLAHFAGIRLDQITVADIDAFRIAKIREGRLGATSINKIIETLTAILETAVEHGVIARNPAKGRKRRLPAATPRRTWLDRAEHITTLLNAAGEMDRDGRAPIGLRRPMVATLAFAGLRLGELRALQWRDVNLDRGIIRVREAKTDAGVRIVNMLPVLRGELAAYRDRLQPKIDDRVFATSSGAAIEPSNIRIRVIARAVERANLALEADGREPLPDGLTPHSLRRTFASLLFALGEPPTYVMSQMGHTTPGLTLALYAREMNRRDGERGRLRALVGMGPPQIAANARSATASLAVRITPYRGTQPRDPRVELGSRS
jgi:integrase